MPGRLTIRRLTRRTVPAAVAVCALALLSAPAGAHVLRVGTYHGRHGQFRTIQAAVSHAHPGDWILIGPGVYHERADHRHPPKGAATSRRPAC